MSITVTLTNDELAQIKVLTKQESDADAVGQAAREFLRLSRLRELKAVSGKVEFDENWPQLEAMELNEVDFPQ